MQRKEVWLFYVFFFIIIIALTILCWTSLTSLSLWILFETLMLI